MPVLSKSRHDMLRAELRKRTKTLLSAFGSRELHGSSEGCRKGHWVSPNAMCATKGSTLEISLAVEDFKAILSELKKLK